MAQVKGKDRSSQRRARSRIPTFKTVEEEAEFWDKHSLTEFEDELEVVDDVVFVRVQPRRGLTVRLGVDELEELKRSAREKGVSASTLVRIWVVERLRGAGDVKSR